MTLTDGVDGTVVAIVTPPVTPPDQWQETAPSNELDNMQYSPNTAMNGYGPYSNPATPEVVSVPPELSPDKLPVEELKVLLRHQLEFYFSRYQFVRNPFIIDIQLYQSRHASCIKQKSLKGGMAGCFWLDFSSLSATKPSLRQTPLRGQWIQ